VARDHITISKKVAWVVETLFKYFLPTLIGFQRWVLPSIIKF
jgi:hypothetical protein